MTLKEKIEKRVADKEQRKELNVKQIVNFETQIERLKQKNELYDIEIALLKTHIKSL